MLLTLGFDGNLNAINPVLNTLGRWTHRVGDCSMPGSPCGLNSANGLGKLGSNIYATDLANNLYSVNPTTGAATLIGPHWNPTRGVHPSRPRPRRP